MVSKHLWAWSQAIPALLLTPERQVVQGRRTLVQREKRGLAWREEERDVVRALQPWAEQGLDLGSPWGDSSVYRGSHPAPTRAPTGLAALPQRSGGGCIPGTGSHHHWHVPSSGPTW